MNIKNILASTDFSDCSESAVSFALELAIKLKARLYIMHAMTSALSIASERLLEKAINNERFREVKTENIIEIGDPGLAILRQTKEVKADLIVMGSKGSSGGRKIVGSTTTEVISKTEIPVLAIPENCTYTGFDDIVFMTDFNEGDLSALKDILKWARQFKANLHVLHLFTVDSLEELIKFRGFKEVAKEHLNNKMLTFERVFNPSFSEGFFDYVHTRNPQLVVLTRYKKSFFQKLMEPDHGGKIEFEAAIPFINFPGEQYMKEEQKVRILKK